MSESYNGICIDGWDAVPQAFRIHCFLEATARNVLRKRRVIADAALNLHELIDVYEQNVIFQADEAETCWETVLLPPDDLGPAHVMYHPDRVEVLRYWASLWGNVTEEADDEHFSSEYIHATIVATLKYDDPDLLPKVLQAATADLLEEWNEVPKPENNKPLNDDKIF